MALSETAKDVLLSNLYYSPSSQLTSIKSLYDAVRNKQITYNEVRMFIQKQESNQLFKRQKKIKNYFPIYSKFKYEILQFDIADMSNLATSNKNYKYLLVAIDVFSRMGFIVPMKNKSGLTVAESAKQILDKTEPTIINCDNGSEFIDHHFKELLNSRGIDINYVSVSDHHRLGIVDRFVRTIREKINKYMEMHNTTNYIDVLPDIVKNYNMAYHSGIKKAPIDVKDEDQDVLNIFLKRYQLAKEEETIFNVGDKIRYIINFKQFEKHTLPRFSKTVHTIKSQVSPHSYELDNGNIKKYYEMQLVNNVEKLNTQQVTPSRKQMNTERRVKRKFKQSGLDTSDILTSRRQMKPIQRLNL